MKLAIVGITGLVGRTIVDIINEQNLQFDEVIPVASNKSIGKVVTINSNSYKVVSIEEALEQKPDIAIFSAGSDVSKKWALEFAKRNIYVIDNSYYWRMDPQIKLIVPEINSHILTPKDKIISNPNCSTIQLVMAISPIHERFKIKRIIISTYQAVSGSGQKAIDQLINERGNKERGNKEKSGSYYPYKIDMNVIPHIDVFVQDGYTKEELKIINETKKILDSPNIRITATAVRIPIENCHCESVNLELEENFEVEDIKELLRSTKGVQVEDKPEENCYPMPLTCNNGDDVRVGRLRKDYSHDNSLNMWIVADNLRKGAATNALQISDYISKKFITSLV